MCIRDRETTTQDARSISPRLEAIAGSAVATMVWSATARNIGSMMGGKTVRNSEEDEGGVIAGAAASAPIEGAGTGVDAAAAGAASGCSSESFIR